MKKNDGKGVSNSANRSEYASPKRIHSPLNKERDAEPKNTNEPICFECQRDEQNPEEYRCRPIKGRPTSSGPGKSPPVSGHSPVNEPKTAGPQPPITVGGEIWTRANNPIKIPRHIVPSLPLFYRAVCEVGVREGLIELVSEDTLSNEEKSEDVATSPKMEG